MPIIRITKEQLEKARKAYEAALEKDPEFRESEKEKERLRDEAEKRLKEEKGEP